MQDDRIPFVRRACYREIPYIIIIIIIIIINNNTMNITQKVHPVTAAFPDTTNNKPAGGRGDLAEEMFALLLADLGLKPSHSEDTVRDMLENVLGYDDDTTKKHPHIGQVQVDVQLERERDQKLPHRVVLAQEVRATAEETLLPHIDPDGSLQLLVRVLLVSDGASVASRRFTSGVGTAKVTIAYCVVDNSSGAVVLANTVYQTAACEGLDLQNYWESSSAVVRSLARQAAQHIVAQITFHLLQWETHRRENRERLERIEVKLAQEEELDADEYAFAAQKHLL